MDAGRAAVVHVVDAVAIRWHEVEAPTTEAAAAAVFAHLPAGVPVTVSLTSETPRMVTVASASGPQRYDDLDAIVLRELGTSALDGTARAALWHDPQHVGGRREGLVATWPAAPVGAVLRALGGHTGSVDVIPSPWVAGQLGDLTLALRQTGSELTWSRDGVPLRSVPLAAGGLDRVEALLGAGDNVGVQRVADALQHGGTHDRLAASALDEWLRDVLTQAVEVLDEWRRQGLQPPAELYVHGKAAASVSLPFLLTDFQLRRARSRPKVAGGMLEVPSNLRPRLAGAFAAGLLSPGDLGPVTTLHDAASAAVATHAEARRRARARMRTAGLAALVVTSAAVVPPLAVDGYTAWVRHEARSAAETLDPALSVDELAELTADRSAAEVGSVAGADLVAAHLVGGVHVTNLQVEPGPGGPLVTLEGHVDAGALIPAQVQTWRVAGLHVVTLTQHAQPDGSWTIATQLEVTP